MTKSEKPIITKNPNVPIEPNANAYGAILGTCLNRRETYPIICGHGGSQYLCPDCADSLFKTGEIVIKPCPFHKANEVSYMGCNTPGCSQNIQNTRGQHNEK